MSATAKFCAHCGAPLTPNARFCEHCGQPVASAPAQPQPQPQPAFAPPPPTYAMPVQPQPMQPPPRKSRAGCVIAVLLALIVLCCLVPVAGGFIILRFSDIGQEIVPTLEAMATEMAGMPAPGALPERRGTPLVDALSGNSQITATPRPPADTESNLPIGSANGAAANVVAQDFVGDWEVVAAQAADGSQRDDLIGNQIRLKLSDDGETILGVELPDDGATEPGLWLRVAGGRAAAGEVIDADPPVAVTATLSEDGETLAMTMKAPSQEVSLTFRRVGEGTGQ